MKSMKRVKQVKRVNFHSLNLFTQFHHFHHFHRVLKCVSHRVPIRREESSVRLVPELGHDALPMDEPNAVTMGLAYPMLHNCIPLYCTLILRSGHDMIE